MQFNRPIYDFDWKKLTRWLVPVVLRQPKLLAFVTACTSGLKYVHSRFLNYKYSTEYDLTITPQVCYLEKALNDRFDYDQRRIKVILGIYYPPLPLFIKDEAKQSVVGQKVESRKLLLFRKNETAQFTSDFIVTVPRYLVFDQNEMNALVNKYCLAGKIFSINKA